MFVCIYASAFEIQILLLKFHTRGFKSTSSIIDLGLLHILCNSVCGLKCGFFHLEFTGVPHA